VKKELTRRNLLGRAGLAIGGAVALGSLACGSDDSDPQPEPQPQEGPQVADFPYEQHLTAEFRLNVEAIKEAAYHAYYAGGCCHGAYSALLADFQRAGAPFTLLPLDFGKFGGGGVAGYGSICGAVLGGVLLTNMVVQNPTTPPQDETKPQDVRANLMTELMRWYETYEFPAYVPTQVDAKEHANADPAAALVTTLPFGNDPAVGNPESMRLAPGSHLCHASVSGWCAAQHVSAAGPDKLARCARLTADVAGKTAEMLNQYLGSDRLTFAVTSQNGTTGCTTCHTKDKASDPLATPVRLGPSVASGMSCTSCHDMHAL
jgi:hypothetical protein